jgi:hypothetical protein
MNKAISGADRSADCEAFIIPPAIDTFTSNLSSSTFYINEVYTINIQLNIFVEDEITVAGGNYKSDQYIVYLLDFYLFCSSPSYIT